MINLDGENIEVVDRFSYLRVRSTDRVILTVNQQLCHSDLVTDFVAVVLSQSEGSGKMALG